LSASSAKNRSVIGSGLDLVGEQPDRLGRGRRARTHDGAVDADQLPGGVHDDPPQLVGVGGRLPRLGRGDESEAGDSTPAESRKGMRARLCPTFGH